MFGAIWAAFVGVGLVAYEIKSSIKDSESKSRAIAEEKAGQEHFGIYRDHKGRERDIKTNELVTMCFDSNNDLVKRTVYGKELRNFSKEDREKELAEAIKNYDEFHTVIKKKRGKYDPKDPFNFEHKIYMDLKTGRELLVKEFAPKNYVYRELFNDNIFEELGTLEFYMDKETGELIRLTDEFKQRYEKEKEKANRSIATEFDKMWFRDTEFDVSYAGIFMDRFNDRQRKIKPELDMNDMMDFAHYYCHGCSIRK